MLNYLHDYKTKRRTTNGRGDRKFMSVPTVRTYLDSTRCRDSGTVCPLPLEVLESGPDLQRKPKGGTR